MLHEVHLHSRQLVHRLPAIAMLMWHGAKAVWTGVMNGTTLCLVMNPAFVWVLTLTCPCMATWWEVWSRFCSQTNTSFVSQAQWYVDTLGHLLHASQEHWQLHDISPKFFSPILLPYLGGMQQPIFQQHLCTHCLHLQAMFATCSTTAMNSKIIRFVPNRKPCGNTLNKACNPVTSQSGNSMNYEGRSVMLGVQFFSTISWDCMTPCHHLLSCSLWAALSRHLTAVCGCKINDIMLQCNTMCVIHFILPHHSFWVGQFQCQMLYNTDTCMYNSNYPKWTEKQIPVLIHIYCP